LTIDRRIASILLLVIGLAGGWYLRALVRPAAEPARAQSAARAPESPRAETTTTRTDAFDQVYKTGRWGRNAAGEGFSGAGSSEKATALYREFLTQFMKEHGVTSVVDAGCGDWTFSQLVDWTGIDYKGYDIVGSVIEQDKQKFAKPNIQFFQADIIEADLPPADLLISKHVLQHLPNADVKKFLVKQLPKYKHILLTDGVDRATLSAPNVDIPIGDYRLLDPTQPPFDIPGIKALTYLDGGTMHQVVYILGRPLAQQP
jgi:SAM-dependent methyltransferase